MTYYRYKPTIDIAPFSKMIVGVTPTSRQVFTVSLERHGPKDKLEDVISALKKALSTYHNNLEWDINGNHHYGRHLEDIDLVVYRMGTLVNGKGTYVLSYSCESKRHLGMILREARELMRAPKKSPQPMR